MWRALAMVTVIFATRAEAGPTCVAYGTYEQAETAALKSTDAHLAAALAKRKLAVANLAHATWNAEKVGRSDVVEERVHAGRRASYVLVGQMQCFTEVEFVSDGSKVYRLVRKPIAGKMSKLEPVCGCGMPRVRGTCWGGAQPPMLLHGYELPVGATFAGPLEVEYVEDKVDATFTLRPCPPPP
jgi:hypothetical protein